MEVRAPYPDMTDKAETPPMLHIVNENDPAVFLCGQKRGTAMRLVKKETIDCVVCAHMYGSNQ